MGRAASIALARRGFDVVISARTLKEGDGRASESSSLKPSVDLTIPGSLESTAREIQSLGARAVAVRMDLTDADSVERACDAALDAFDGRIDVIFNNAIYQGPGTMDRILDLPIERATTIMAADYVHQLRIIQRLVPQMVERGEGGRIVNMTSEAGFDTPPAPAGKGGWGVAYAAAKAALHRVTVLCHVEYADAGIFSFSVNPGLVITESMRARDAHKVFEKVGIVAAPPEVAGEVVAWLGGSPDDDVRQHSGTVVSSRQLCKELHLLDGWPPPR